MKGDDGDTVHGDDGISAAMQNVQIGDNTYSADDIITVKCIGASGVLNGNTLEVSGLKGDQGEVGPVSTEPGPPGSSATTIVKAPDLAGQVVTYTNPPSLAFANAVGGLEGDTLTITAGGFSITTDDATTYPLEA